MANTDGLILATGIYAAPGKLVSEILTDITDVTTAHLPKPTYCIVQGGGNDIRNDGTVTTATLTADLEDIFDALTAAGIQPIASTVLPGVPAPYEQRVEDAYIGTNAWLRSYCPANNIPLIDWLPGMTTDENEVLLDATLCVDDYHPNADGLAVMAAATLEVLAAR